MGRVLPSPWKPHPVSKEQPWETAEESGRATGGPEGPGLCPSGNARAEGVGAEKGVNGVRWGHLLVL